MLKTWVKCGNEEMGIAVRNSQTDESKKEDIKEHEVVQAFILYNCCKHCSKCRAHVCVRAVYVSYMQIREPDWKDEAAFCST